MQIDRRKKEIRDFLASIPKPEGLLSETIDGQEFAYRYESRCRVCSAPDKDLPQGGVVKNLVETLLVHSMPYLFIERKIEPLMAEWPDKAKITYASIRTHQMRHLKHDQLAFRMIAERNAQLKGKAILLGMESLVTEEAFLEATQYEAWRRLMDGQMEVRWADAATAFKRRQEIDDTAAGQFNLIELKAQLDFVIAVIRESVPPELWPGIAARLSSWNNTEELPEEAVIVEEEGDPFPEFFEAVPEDE